MLITNDCLHEHTQKRHERNLTSNVQSGMVEGTFNPSTREEDRWMDLSQFKASLG